MKNISIIIWLFLLLVSCDPITYVSYNIANSTDENLALYFYSSVAIENDTLSLIKNSVEEWRIVSVSDRSPEKIDLNQYYDSIIVKSNNHILKKYFWDMNGKNIYNYDYWVESNKGKRNYEYTFEITEEDIATTSEDK